MLRQPFQLPSDHFAQRAVSHFLANCINAQFCLQLEEKRKMKKLINTTSFVETMTLVIFVVLGNKTRIFLQKN